MKNKRKAVRKNNDTIKKISSLLVIMISIGLFNQTPISLINFNGNIINNNNGSVSLETKKI